MSELTLQSVWSPPLKNLSLSFGPGMHVLLGAEADGTSDVIELCAGVRLPQRGRVALDGETPGASPRARGQIASLRPASRSKNATAPCSNSRPTIPLLGNPRLV